MATQDDVRINIIADTKQAITDMAKFAAGIGAAIVVARKLIQIGADMVKAYGEQEQAEAKLATAIKATGREAEINQKALSRLATQLQSVTTYGDETTVSAMALLQQLANLNQQGLEKVTPAMLDFAAAMGVDLQTAASLIGKTLGSSTNALSRYGIEIDATATQTEKLDQLTAALNEKFAGTAEAIGNTALGKYQRFQNAVGDLKEIGGAMLSTFLTPAVSRLTLLAQGIVGGTISVEDFGKTWEEQITNKVIKDMEKYPNLGAFFVSEGLTRFAGGMEAINKNMPTFDSIQIENLVNTLQKAAELTAQYEGKFFPKELTEAQQIEEAIELLGGYRNQIRALGGDYSDLQAFINKLDAKLKELNKDNGTQAEISGFLTNLIIDQGEAQRTLAGMVDESAIANAVFLEKEERLGEIVPEVTNDFDNQIEAVNRLDEALGQIVVNSGEMEEHLEKEKDLYEQIATSALPLFEAMGASIVDASTGWEKFKDAATDAIAGVLMALAKEYAIEAAGYLFKAIATGNPLDIAAFGPAAAAAAAAAAGAGFVQALGEGGIVTKPTLAVIGERGPEAVVPLNKGMGNVMILNVYGNLLTERQLVDGILRRAANQMRPY